MRLHRHCRLIALLPVVLAGCSTTVGSRFGGTPHSRSIAVVGDQSLPASTGEPGGQVAAGVVEPEPRRNPKTRISGRVLDESGEPVPNATVRLADGGTKGGKDIRGTTDRSGAFTLNGLRPGTTYSLIAESEDDRGALTGRVEARTSDTGVEINLASLGTGATSTRRSARPSRVKPISNRDETGESPEAEQTPRINREDVSPPAEEVDSLDPGPPPPASRPGRPQLSSPEPTVGWKPSGTSTAGSGRDRDVENVATSPDGSTRRRRAVTEDVQDGAEDDQNPLPPAIDPDSTTGAASARSSKSRKVGSKVAPKAHDSGEIALGPEASLDEKSDRARSLAKDEPERSIAAEFRAMPPLEPGPDSGPIPKPRSIEVAVAASPPAGLLAMPPVGSDPITTPEAPRPTASPPAAPSVTQDVAPINPASEPVFASQGPPAIGAPSPAIAADYNPFALATAFPPETTRAVDVLPANREIPTESEAAPEAPRKKWGELASIEKKPVVIPTRATTTGSLVKRLRTSVEGRDSSVAQCSYDSKLRKVNDFRLPDLEGKPVRFQELDADYVLLDFWGTWCGPCLNSIPHLVALQKKYDPSKLRVVGIASEEVPPEQRKAKIEEVSRKLGINYSVLLSGMDGKPCPVQQALQVQAMPTMVLLDRKGQVLWRSTGATPATQDRLDRVLASSMSRGDAARR